MVNFIISDPGCLTGSGSGFFLDPDLVFLEGRIRVNPNQIHHTVLIDNISNVLTFKSKE